LLSDSFAITSNIGPLAHHKFIHNNSQCIVIDLKAVVLPSHHLWSHISWGATSVMRVFLFKLFCDAEVSEVEITYIYPNIPFSSKTRFSGFMSLWIILCECMYYRARKMQAVKKRVCCSVNLCLRQIW
jgi:hypothetical protein